MCSPLGDGCGWRADMALDLCYRVVFYCSGKILRTRFPVQQFHICASRGFFTLMAAKAINGQNCSTYSFTITKETGTNYFLSVHRGGFRLQEKPTDSTEVPRPTLTNTRKTAFCLALPQAVVNFADGFALFDRQDYRLFIREHQRCRPRANGA